MFIILEIRPTITFELENIWETYLPLLARVYMYIQMINVIGGCDLRKFEICKSALEQFSVWVQM